MQELIEKLIGEHGGAWLEKLSGLGFSMEQAKEFLPASLEAIVDRFQNGGFDLSSLLGNLDVDSILGKLDLGALAQKAGVDEGLAQNGLKELIPDIAEKVTGDGGLLGKLGGDAGGLLGKARDLLG